MERRTFLTALVPAALVPATLVPAAALSASTPQFAGLKTPVVPDSGPESYFWVKRQYHEGELQTSTIIGDDDALAAHRRLKGWQARVRDSKWSTRYRKVRFSTLNRERRFMLVLAEWKLDPGASHSHSTPRTEADMHRHAMASLEFQDPASLLDVPHGQGTSELHVRNSDWLTRESAFAKAAEYNAESATKHMEEHGYVYGCDWWTVVEFGRPVAKPLIYLTIENGVGQTQSSLEYPIRLVEPTEAEKARYPFKAVLDQFEPAAV